MINNQGKLVDNGIIVYSGSHGITFTMPSRTINTGVINIASGTGGGSFVGGVSNVVAGGVTGQVLAMGATGATYGYVHPPAYYMQKVDDNNWTLISEPGGTFFKDQNGPKFQKTIFGHFSNK